VDRQLDDQDQTLAHHRDAVHPYPDAVHQHRGAARYDQVPTTRNDPFDRLVAVDHHRVRACHYRDDEQVAAGHDCRQEAAGSDARLRAQRGGRLRVACQAAAPASLADALLEDDW
jgi:hypothetical protein